MAFRIGTAERLIGDVVAGNYFEVLGVQSAMGRLLDPKDDRPGAPAVAVLSFGMWQRKFNSEQRAIETSITVNGNPFTIVESHQGISAAPRMGGPSTVGCRFPLRARASRGCRNRFSMNATRDG
jgi:hypothetical protein